eukprot:2105509-Prymnesium_polylepis.1
MVRSRRASKARCWTLEFIDAVDVASLLRSYVSVPPIFNGPVRPAPSARPAARSGQPSQTDLRNVK